MPDESPQPKAAIPSPVSLQGQRSSSTERVRCFLLTVSNTRTPGSDTASLLVAELLEGAGHVVIGREIVSDTTTAIESTTRASVYHRDEPEAIIVAGGTGIGQSDVTPEALRPLLTKEIPGFGEVFRMLWYQDLGAGAMDSRAFAGVLGRTLLFVLPDSMDAVRLAMEKLILPELGQLVREVRPERRKMD